MGINTYGLFRSNELNTQQDNSYEIKRQLAARQAQLDAYNKKSTLSEDDEKKREQLSNAVDQLSSRLSRKSSGNASSASISELTDKFKGQSSGTSAKVSLSENDFAEGRVIAKSPYAAQSPYYNKGSLSGSNTSDGSAYLKGFFVDIKI